MKDTDKSVTHHMPWHKECSLMTTHHFSHQFHSLMALQTALELYKDNVKIHQWFINKYLSFCLLKEGPVADMPDS